ncbi:MAG: DUF927 domain-containing protein [Rhodospirillaceae bacterium]|nr:MAG: DUF927 domain-containing protein [Rhodospirillaceae bacterium]
MKSKPHRDGKFKIKQDGIWFEDSGDTPERIAPYIEKIADLTSSKGWQTLIKFENRRGEICTLTPPRSEVRKRQILRDLLTDQGYDWPPTGSERETLLTRFLADEPGKQIAIVEKTGWYKNDTFVSLDSAIGPKADNVRYREVGYAPEIPNIRGSRKIWRRVVSDIVPCSASAMLALGTPFGAPFHQILRIESGGFNLFGPPGKGKTSCAVAAVSVFGPSGRENLQTWDASPAALDEMRSEHSDMLVYLDDTGRAGKSDHQRIDTLSDGIFRLTTGLARRRSKRFKVDLGLGSSWLALLSTSVRSIRDISLAADSHVFGGEEVRLIDVPAVASEKLGIFEKCPEKYENTAAAVYALEKACAANYGVAGREYISKIVADKAASTEFVRKMVDRFLKHVGVEDSSESRYAKRFGLAYAGLKLAEKHGVIRLPKNSAWKAINLCYRRAREVAPSYPRMVAQASSNLRKALLELDGIIDLSRNGRTTTKAKFADCRGILLDYAKHGLVYAVKLEELGALSGTPLTSRQVMDRLKERGLLIQVKGGKATIPISVPGIGKADRQRLVCIKTRELKAQTPDGSDDD